MKRICIGLILLSFFLFSASAEQLTTVGIIDVNKVANAFFKESMAVREIEEMKAEIQQELNRLSEEIKALKSRKLSAESSGNEERVLELDEQIYTKTEYLQEYYRIKRTQLEEKQSRLAESSSFLNELQNAISFIAENEGFSVIVKKSDPNIIWWSKEIDITDKVIQRLIQTAAR